MINKLQNRCFCFRIYASTNSSASNSIMERDFNMNNRNANIMDNLTGCDGNAQQAIHFLTHTTKHVQLCVISYAGEACMAYFFISDPNPFSTVCMIRSANK
ncbi:hypothetical protein BCV72DRAFT_326973 [Rhizopus microsporus var. microsporus]|uniref:Uncharacterized protein n=1 Tax=Rhizopus microsporus var. microsporus TaxID=86635 RepID=A0A1X0R5B1_RHIZD|nr:hypothetical protein BCV72DRAFT_326973 [Rhizopus microsporus var. microsporus]